MDETKWQEIQNKYNFNAIFFPQQEGTWWGQNFLANRFNDSLWAIIYADSQAVILVKNNEGNKKLIEKYQITKNNVNDKISALKAVIEKYPRPVKNAAVKGGRGKNAQTEKFKHTLNIQVSRIQ